MMISPHCPSCNLHEVRKVGGISPANTFAGRTLQQPIEGGYLWCCVSCNLSFRSPVLDKTKLDMLYRAGAEYTWSSSSTHRYDWKTAKRWLYHVLPHGSDVLDVGCFDGGFLDSIDDVYNRYGIEISPSAHKRAGNKGISMVGTDFESLPQNLELMDFVTAFDVIEHVHQPADFLARCVKLVKPGGWIVISSGNADSRSFRFMGSRYWYCTLAEHLSFINPKWCYKVADELGIVVETYEEFSHGKHDLFKYFSELTKNVFYRITPGFSGWLRKHGFGKIDTKNHLELAAHPPSWMTAKDHFIVLFRKC